ncbi:hypothetical protein DSO57_1021358 [Entomophthora muscae]|uniref:Uncharacterized protein n=1 Tax=Entomophthora muscae TaxID=34485 RepID=A0ACC2UCC7_9FUNG|nr:hypothetical protein DSO57_1021358 [Entomophthora muscae]
MKEIPTPSLCPKPPDQYFSNLGFVYITVLGLANQVVPHTESWRILATAVNYIVRIVPIVLILPLLWESSQTLAWTMTLGRFCLLNDWGYLVVCHDNFLDVALDYR